jgi:RHS repeat-associated protein
MRVQPPYNQSFTCPYSFQAQERDDEVKGDGNSVNYSFRIHDPRLGRFFAIDPLAAKYPSNSVYAFSENVVINAVELEGKERSYTFNSAYLSAKALTAIKTMNYEDLKEYMDNLVGTKFSTQENLEYAKRMLGDGFDDAPGYNSDGKAPLSYGNRAVKGSYESGDTKSDYFYVRLVIDNGDGTWSVKNAKVTDYAAKIEQIENYILSLEDKVERLETHNENLNKSIKLIADTDISYGAKPTGGKFNNSTPGYEGGQGGRNVMKIETVLKNEKKIKSLTKEINKAAKNVEKLKLKTKIEYE